MIIPASAIPQMTPDARIGAAVAFVHPVRKVLKDRRGQEVR